MIQFKNEPDMEWNLLLYRSTYTKDSRSHNINFPIDLNNPCLACQTPVKLSIKKISDQKIELNYYPMAMEDYLEKE